MDKYKAVWLSHSSIRDYLNCPRLYYLRNIYKDPKTNHKITVMTPPLALGQAVHDAIGSLSNLETEVRFNTPVSTYLDRAWKNISGEKGGFKTKEQEKEYKDRGLAMLKIIDNNPGPLENPIIKISTQDNMPPNYWFSESDNLVLCGKIDWLEYVKDTNSIHIIDFKTGKNEEELESLQLPIYLLLALNTQSRKVSKASYWYLEKNETPTEIELPDANDSIEKISQIGTRIALARKLGHYKCPTDGCKYCYPLEQVLRGKGKKVGVSDIRQDIYILLD